MGKMSRDKGKRGEREVASMLRDYGYDGKRGQQFCGINGDADVVGLPGIHIEVKRVETLRLYDALYQSRRDAKEDEVPTVWHRKNDCEWVVILSAHDFVKMYKEAKDD